MAKAKKKRAEKYEDKLFIKGSFEDVIKLSVTPPAKAITLPEKSEKKTSKKK
jgi:hypothetical protein